jgi:acetyl esterase/lipase
MFNLRRLCTALLVILALAAVGAFGQLMTYRHVLVRPDRPQPDLKIPYGADPNQIGELWLPKDSPFKNKQGKLPVVLMIHGGCWLAELPGPELLAFQAGALRDAGLAVWSITYRRLGNAGGGYPGTFLDVAAGADKLYALAEKYPLDLTRVVATGHSAGGHLALWAAARRRIDATSPLKADKPLPIEAVVGVAPIPDLAYGAQAVAHACGAATIPRLVDLTTRGAATAIDGAWRDTSPLALLPFNNRQTLIFGSRDTLVPPDNADSYKSRAANLGEPVAVVNLQGAGHFELISPWTPAGREVVERIVKEIR